MPDDFPYSVLVNGRPGMALAWRTDHRGRELLIEFESGLKTWWRADVVRPNPQPRRVARDRSRYKSTPPPPSEAL